MGEFQKQVLPVSAKVVLYSLIMAGLFVIGFDSWESRTFVGDDFEVFNAVDSGSYLNTWSEILRDASLDKWRPINNLFIFITVNSFGNSYPAFWFINTLLMASLGAVMVAFFFTIGFGKSVREQLVITLGVLVVVTSPMTFFSRQGIFGFLELAPLVFSVVAYGLFLKPKRRHALVWSPIALGMAALTHERYLVVSIGLALAAYARSKSDGHYKNSARRFLIFPAIWFCTMVFALGANPLRGGGEQAFNDSVGPWLLGRFVDVALLLSGASFGTTVQMDPEGFSSLILTPTEFFGVPLRLWACGVWALILLPTLGSFISTLLRRSRVAPQAGTSSADDPSRKVVQELALMSALLLLPAATVVSRVEMRWLLGSLLFGVLAIVVAQLSTMTIMKKPLNGVLTLAVLLVVNAAGWPSHAHYNMYRTNTYSLINSIQETIGDIELRRSSFFVITDENSGYLEWSTNNGHLITQLNADRISDVIFYSASQNLPQCAPQRTHICFEVTVTSLTYMGEIAISTDVIPAEHNLTD